MIKAYAAGSLQDAHILKGLLAAQGIEARILNASAQGGLGEIPFCQAYPEIWLTDARDLERARAVIAGFERPPSTVADLACPACGEDNPDCFAVCWNCAAALEIR